MKTIDLLFTFYKSFLFPALLITACCWGVCYQFGFSAVFPTVVLKLITLAIIFALVNEYKKHEYYYYHNLGLSKTKLWVYTLLFDFVLCMIPLIIICGLQ